MAATPTVLDKEGDPVEPRLDPGHIGQGRGQPFGQQSRARSGHRAVDDGQERAAPFARQRLGEFQVTPGRGIDLHHRAVGAGRRQAARAREARHTIDLGQRQIVEQRTRGGDFRPARIAKGFQRADAVGAVQALARVFGIEPAGGQRRQDVLELAAQPRHVVARQKGLRHQQFAGRDPLQRGGQQTRAALGGQRLHPDLTGGHVQPGQSEFVAHIRAGREVVVAARVKQRVLAQRARRDDPHDLAPDDGFRAALFRLGRVLHLFAHRDAVPGPDQARQVLLGRVHGHAGHRHRFALMLAARRQSDVEGLCRGDRVIEEQLVEIAHAEKQQAVGIGRLGLLPLGEHGRGAVGDHCGRVRTGPGNIHGEPSSYTPAHAVPKPCAHVTGTHEFEA